MAGLSFSAAVYILYLIYGLILIGVFKAMGTYLLDFRKYMGMGFAIIAILLGALNIKDFFRYI